MISRYLLLTIIRSLKCENKKHETPKPQVQTKPRSVKSKLKGTKCRVCLQDTGNICLFSGNMDCLDITEALMLCANINIQEDDTSYPKHLCLTCYDSLLKANQFRLLAKQSDAVLKTTIKEKTCNTREEVLLRKVQQNEKDKEMEQHYDIEDRESLHTTRKVICKLCKKILSAIYFKSHLITMHYNNEKTYVCEICGKSYRHSSAFSEHKKLHSNGFPYLCSSCPFQAKHKGLLEVHMRHHTGNKKYMCSECPSRFYTASNLSRHLKTHMEPQYKCDYCAKPFRWKINLNNHIEVQHLGIRKKFPCTICVNEYASKKKLYNHEIKKHGRKRNKHCRMPSYLKVQNVDPAD